MPRGLWEREDELARVDALITAARAGHGGVLLVTGPAGIGKTVLLETARERAGQAGMRVLTGRGGELESGFSFGVARQLFEPLLIGASAAEREALLAGAAQRALIALEDFRGSRDQAGPVPPETVPPEEESEPPFAVMHGLSGLAVALALSWRAAETGDGGDRLARLEKVAADGVVSLTPLSRSGVQTLLTQEFGTVPSDRFAAACHAVTGGNAFLLRELIQQLRADGIGPGEEVAAQIAALGPRSVARAVALRVARLGPSAGELARAAAVLGDGAQLRHAATLAGVGLADAAAAADGLAGIGVLEPGTPLRFVHPIVRTAVHDDIPAASRGLRHAEAARLLAAEGADLDAVCAHLLVCEPTGSAEVVERLRAAAARAVGRGAPESAVAYLRRALAETADVGLRAQLARELGRVEKVLGDPGAADHLLQ